MLLVEGCEFIETHGFRRSFCQLRRARSILARPFPEDVVDELRGLAAELMPNASSDELDLAVSVAASVVSPQASLAGITPPNADVHRDLPVGLTDDEIKTGRGLAVEHYRRRAARLSTASKGSYVKIGHDQEALFQLHRRSERGPRETKMPVLEIRHGDVASTAGVGRVGPARDEEVIRRAGWSYEVETVLR